MPWFRLINERRFTRDVLDIPSYLVLLSEKSLLGLLWRAYEFCDGYDLMVMLCPGVCGEDHRRSLARAKFNDVMDRR